MRRLLTILFLLACLFVPLLAHAQAITGDGLTPPLPTAGERKAADVISYATVGLNLALDAKAAWDSPDRSRAVWMMAWRMGATVAIADAVKLGVHRLRPCAPSCGIDSPESSFYSLHTALAFSAIGGPRLAFSLPFAVSTGGLRIAAGKHYLSDVLVGAGAGLLASRIR